MISWARVLTIVKKDIAWARSNVKMLILILLPVLVTVFFSRIDSAATFTFSLVFVNAFVGIFSTSFSVMEEKNRGTLLALLTTPLTSTELLLGKFIYNLILCSVFSVLVILLNQRFDLFANPLALLSIVLFAGTACFVGFVVGVFFKTEQEMSVLAPFLMFLFCAGDSFQKASIHFKVQAFLPDYQLVKILKDVPLDFSVFVEALLVSSILFAVSLAMAGTYTQFYFSNNRERRLSKGLMGFIGAFALVLFLTGFKEVVSDSSQVPESSIRTLSIKTPHVELSSQYDGDQFKAFTLLESQDKTLKRLRFKKEKEANVVMAVRNLESDETTIEKRRDKVEKDPQRSIFSHKVLPWQDSELDQWVYASQRHFILLREIICGPQIVQISLDVKLAHMKQIGDHLKDFESIFKSLQFDCLQP